MSFKWKTYRILIGILLRNFTEIFYGKLRIDWLRKKWYIVS